jgi:hypothetical protein
VIKGTRPKDASRATWFDDEPAVVRRFLPTFKNMGYKVEIQNPLKCDIDKVEFSPLAFVDLDFGRSQLTAERLVRTLTGRDKTVRLLLVSRYFNRPKFHRIDQLVSPTVRIEYLDKLDLEKAAGLSYNTNHKVISLADASAEVERSINLVREKLDRLTAPIEESDPVSLPDISNCGIIETELIPDFHRLSLSVQDAVVTAAYSHFEPALAKMFDSRPEAMWITAGIPTGEILLWGKDDEDPPFAVEHTKLLARRALRDCVPVTFHRPVFYPEITPR